jgi:hypothetical protein
VRHYCESRARSVAAAARATPNHEVADYLAGYAEALADTASERHGGAPDD